MPPRRGFAFLAGDGRRPEGEAVCGVEEELRQVAVPDKAGCRGERGFLEPDRDQAVAAGYLLGACGAGGPGGVPGPVRTAAGRLALAAKARVIASDCWKGESVNSKRGRWPREGRGMQGREPRLGLEVPEAKGAPTGKRAARWNASLAGE